MLPNIPQFIIAYFAILKIGGVVVAFSPLYGSTEIINQAKDAGISLLFVMKEQYEFITNIKDKTTIQRLILVNEGNAISPYKNIRIRISDRKNPDVRVKPTSPNLWLVDLIMNATTPDWKTNEIDSKDVALFQYSGGTTGIPKAAVALHQNVVANVMQIKNWMTFAVPGEEVTLMAIPLYHVYGMVCGLLFSISIRSAMVLIKNAGDFLKILKSIQKYKASYFPGVPTMFNAFVNHPSVLQGKFKLRSIKACISGSSTLSISTKEKFETLTGGKVFEGYGLSEAPTATHINPIYGVNKAGSIGLPLPDVDVKIVDLEDPEIDLKPESVGEMILKGPQVMVGYHNNSDETEINLKNGWLLTGDLAKMDQEGYFYILGRKKELIKRSGFQVWPDEVEEAIRGNDKVLDVGVAGVPDDYRGEIVVAWVVPKPGKTITKEEIISGCQSLIAIYKVPSDVVIIQTLPKSGVGKLLRRELTKSYIDENFAKR